MWNLSDCNLTWTFNHLVGKEILNDLDKLAKWLSCFMVTCRYGALTVYIYHVTFGCKMSLFSVIAWKIHLNRVKERVKSNYFSSFLIYFRCVAFFFVTHIFQTSKSAARFVLVIAWFRVQLKINLTSVN